MIHEKTAVAVITELISEKNRKREFLFAELQLKDEYNPFDTHFIIATFYYYQILFVEFTPWKRQNELCNHFAEGHLSSIKFTIDLASHVLHSLLGTMFIVSVT